MFASAAARALPATVLEDQRSVAVDASSGALADAGADAAAAPAFEASESATAGETTAGATQASDASAARIAGAGTAATAAASAPGQLAAASAESIYRIVFQLDADLSLRLTGTLGAEGEGAGDALALLELSTVDPLVEPFLLRFEQVADDAADGPLPIDAVFDLRGGVAYRLLVVARAFGDSLDLDGVAQHAAAYRFELAEVPEPASALLVALGLALLRRRAA